MAWSGTLNLHTNNALLEAKLDWQVLSQNLEARTSTVKGAVYVRLTQNKTISGTWEGNIDMFGEGAEATDWFKKSFTVSTSWVKILEKTTNIKHFNSGVAFFKFRGWLDTPKDSGYNMSMWHEGEYIVTTYIEPFPSASNISTTKTVKIGSVAPLVIEKSHENSTLLHTITYSFKGEDKEALTGTIATLTDKLNINWVLPDILYSKMPTTISGALTLKIETFASNAGATNAKVGENTFLMTAAADEAKCKPTLNPEVKDTNTTTVALTGNNKTLVKYYSNAYTKSNVTARFYTELKSQKTQLGSRYAETTPHTFYQVESNKFVFSTTDKRNYSATQTVTTPFVDYIKLSCYIENTYPTSSGNYTFTVKGNYFNASFGAVNNTLSVYYKWKSASDDNFSAWEAMTLEYDENSYTATAQLSGLDYQGTYVFQAYAVDKLATVYTNETVIKAKPVFDWSGQDFAFNVPVTIMGKPLYTETVLYSGGTRETVTLNYSVANYDYIEIFYTDNNNRGYAYTKVYGAEGKEIDLCIVESSPNGTSYIRQTRYTASGNTLTPDIAAAGYIYFAGTSTSRTSGTNYLKIYRVVGIK